MNKRVELSRNKAKALKQKLVNRFSLKRRPKKAKSNTSFESLFQFARIAFFLIAIYLFNSGALASAATIFFRPVVDGATFFSANMTADPRIINIANNSGLNFNGKMLFYRSKPELVDPNTLQKHCPSKDGLAIEYGCYDYAKNKMYILNISDTRFDEAMYVTAAHETLHIVWGNLSRDGAARIGKQLNQVNAEEKDGNPASKATKDTLKNLYDGDEATQLNELHSRIGSEYALEFVPDELEKHYAKYFSDRRVPVSAQREFEDSVESEENALLASVENLNKLSSEIDDYKVRFIDPFDAAIRNSAYYGNKTSYDKNVAGLNANTDTYNVKVNFYNDRLREHQEKLKKFNDAISAMKPTDPALTQPLRTF